MADPIFEHPRLIEIYDAFDGERHDLDHYLAIARELDAASVIDVGCGTGCFAILLKQHGFDVTGVDPAKASVDIAQRKTGAVGINWIVGDSADIPPLNADLAVMTGNVAQVFVTDEAWEANLNAIHQALKPGGHLVFEVRDPAQKAWQKWTRERTHTRLDIPGIGFVDGWCDVLGEANGILNFRWTYTFESDGETLSSDSTLRFREKEDVILSLEKTGYMVKEIRDAPDRPKMEFVFIAKAL